MVTLIGEVIGISPRLGAVFLGFTSFWDNAFRSEPNNEPDTGHDVTQVDNVQDETGKAGKIVLSLL